KHRQPVAFLIALRPLGIAVEAFHHVPAEIHATGSPSRDEIDLLPGILTDITDIEITGRVIKSKAERITQPDRPDLIAHVGVINERVVWRDAVGVAVFDI